MLAAIMQGHSCWELGSWGAGAVIVVLLWLAFICLGRRVTLHLHCCGGTRQIHWVHFVVFCSVAPSYLGGASRVT